MMAPKIAREAQQAITLIKAFSLDLDQYGPESQVLYWINVYRAPWIRDAIIEAVYQGRYKIVSVGQILVLWERRGQPIRHFTAEFEQVIAAQLGTPLHMHIDSDWQKSSPRDKELSYRTTPSLHQANEATSCATKTGRIEHSSIVADELINCPEIADITDNTGTGLEIPSALSKKCSPLSDRAIAAFQVNALDDLVEVYQAGVEPNQLVHPATATPEMKKDNLMYYPGYIRVVKSAPIQAFQPDN